MAGGGCIVAGTEVVVVLAWQMVRGLRGKGELEGVGVVVAGGGGFVAAAGAAAVVFGHFVFCLGWRRKGSMKEWKIELRWRKERKERRRGGLGVFIYIWVGMG